MEQVPSISKDSSNPLVAVLSNQIRRAPDQRITFAEFMETALYHPQNGYYAKRREKIGAQGDFVTSPHLSMDFGELIAEQLAQMWHALSCPNPFTLVEMGAGQGLLASDVLRYLHDRHPDCFDSLKYCIIEKAAAHIIEQQHRLQTWLDAVPIEWTSIDAIPNGSIVGCFFSNELIDAFPVHLVTLGDQQLQEIYVSVKDDHLIETIGELSTPAISQYFDLIGIDFSNPAYQTGYRTEVNLAALDWISTIAQKLDRGYVLTIDYGYLAPRYYNPGRDQGTLQCYYQHSHHNDPYQHLGEQDITAHVDFTALQKQGDRVGLETLGFVQQALFLMALGLGDRLTQNVQTEATSTEDLQNRLRRREALHQLMNPLGLGGFGVLIQGKQLSEAEKNLTGVNQRI